MRTPGGQFHKYNAPFHHFLHFVHHENIFQKTQKMTFSVNEKPEFSLRL